MEVKLTSGERVRKLRKEADKSQEKLALAIRESRASICTWESKNQIPPTETIIKTAEYFNISTSYLIGISEDMSLTAEENSVPTNIKYIEAPMVLDMTGLSSEERYEMINRYNDIIALKKENKEKKDKKDQTDGRRKK